MLEDIRWLVVSMAKRLIILWKTSAAYGLIRIPCCRGSGGSGDDKRKGQPTKELPLSFRIRKQFPPIEWHFLNVGEYLRMLGPLAQMPFTTYLIKVY